MGNDGNEYSMDYANDADEITFKIWDTSTETLYISQNSVIWENGNIQQIELNSVLSSDGDAIVPLENSLSQNYPNPFNPTTTISFALKTNSDVKIEVFNTKGQLVEKILDEHREAGYHTVSFVADKFSSGVYFYKISADQFDDIKKMVLLK